MDIKQNYKVVFTNDAIIDMDNTFNYISKNLNSPRAAKNLRVEIIFLIKRRLKVLS